MKPLSGSSCSVGVVSVLRSAGGVLLAEQIGELRPVKATYLQGGPPMTTCKRLVRSLVREESGQGITEYALIVGLVVLGIWVAVSASNLGAEITLLFGRIKNVLGLCKTGACGG